ncbi:MAG: hypothetical protein HY738_17710 [Bacteroidia bacterium]|nr:hypothetical protein [Bacteroidia bacterium]
MNKEKNEQNVLFVVIAIMVILLLSFIIEQIFKENLFTKVDSPPQKLSSKEQKILLENECRKLEKLIYRKKELERKKLIAFNTMYFVLKTILLILLAIYYYVGYLIIGFDDFLGDFLNWTGIGLVGFALISFVIFKDFKDVLNVIDILRLKLKKMIYQKYLNINDSIEENQKRLEISKAELKKL